jgi:dienelactone hydrolase
MHFSIDLMTIFSRCAKLGFAVTTALGLAGATMAQPAPALGNHSIVTAVLNRPLLPVGCTNVALDIDKITQSGLPPSDYYEGIPQNGQLRYLNQVLKEPTSTILITPKTPDEGLYPQYKNENVPFVVIVCYPTLSTNTRPNYVLPDGQIVPRMQRIGDKPIFATLAPTVPTAPGFVPSTSVPLPTATLKLGLSNEPPPTSLPLILFSHGLGSSPIESKSVDFLVRMAGYGYIVAAPFHGDARFSKIRVADVGDLVSVIRDFDRFVELQAMRPLAIKSTVDALLAHPDFIGTIDPKRIGGLGGSMGGATLTWLAGAQVTDNITRLSSKPTVQDARVKAVVGYVPYAGQRFLPAFGNDNNTAKNVNIPYLAIAGTADTTAPIYLMEQAMNNFQHSRYMVALTDVTHGYSTTYADDVFGWLIPFFDGYVKGDRAALQKFITMKNIAGGLDDNLRIDYTTPTTFNARTLLGIEFYNNNLNRYLITADSGEAAALDATSSGWTRTSNNMRVALAPVVAPEITPLTAFTDTAPVCRFYNTVSKTHFYTVESAECFSLIATPGTWVFEGTPFHARRIARTPASSGTTPVQPCAPGSIALYRANSNRPAPDLAYRYSTSNALMDEMRRKDWVVDGAAMCLPL